MRLSICKVQPDSKDFLQAHPVCISIYLPMLVTLVAILAVVSLYIYHSTTKEESGIQKANGTREDRVQPKKQIDIASSQELNSSCVHGGDELHAGSSKAFETSANGLLIMEAVSKLPAEKETDVLLHNHTHSDVGTQSSDEEDMLDTSPPAVFPSMNSAQRVSATPRLQLDKADPSQRHVKDNASTMMPPPPRLVRPSPSIKSTAGSRLAPQAQAYLPLPPRGPPSSGLGVPNSNSNQSRKKVILQPGHSPLDWAQLQRSGTNLAGVDALQRVTQAMLKHNNGRKGRPAWSSYQGKVYNITPYVPFHPGGEGEIRRGAGRDGEKLFTDVHPWVNWENMLGECVVGILVSDRDGEHQHRDGALDDMD